MTSMTKTKNGSVSKTKKMTKKDQLIAMLRRKSGGTIAEASKKFGWQQHTTRAALTSLRHSGYEVETRKSKSGQSTSYHIVKNADDEVAG